MVCSVCRGEIRDSKRVKLFDRDVCSMCFHSIGEIPVNHIFYDFYKDRLKAILKTQLSNII